MNKYLRFIIYGFLQCFQAVAAICILNAGQGLRDIDAQSNDDDNEDADEGGDFHITLW